MIIGTDCEICETFKKKVKAPSVNTNTFHKDISTKQYWNLFYLQCQQGTFSAFLDQW